MINFIDLLNWAATIFGWLLCFLLARAVLIAVLDVLLAPFLSKPKPRDWVKKEKDISQTRQAWWEAWEAWHAEHNRCIAAGLPCPSQREFMDKVRGTALPASAGSA